MLIATDAAVLFLTIMTLSSLISKSVLCLLEFPMGGEMLLSRLKRTPSMLLEMTLFVSGVGDFAENL
jgi:hypothetical protein